jgi:hypothetical protein
MPKPITEKIGTTFRGCLYICGTLIGVKWKGQWDYESLAITAWIFLLGLPIGTMMLGSAFSLSTWFLGVLICLMLVNIDDALIQMSNYIMFGVDGEVPPYERQK